MSSAPPVPSEFATDFAMLEQQALAAPKVKLLDQAEWYRGLSLPKDYEKSRPRVRKASYSYQFLLIYEEDVIPGELPLALQALGSGPDITLSKQVVQHDLLVRPTESGYQAIMVDVDADFPEASLYCAAPLFGIWVEPKGEIKPALLPLYLAWWLNVHQPLCENPEVLIQSCIPMPPVALQRQLLALLALGG